MIAHSPTPWRNDSGVMIRDKDFKVIANLKFSRGIISASVTDEERHANLALMVAAPMMAEALDKIARLLDGREWISDDIETVAEIVRGTGRTIGPPDEYEDDAVELDPHFRRLFDNEPAS